MFQSTSQNRKFNRLMLIGGLTLFIGLVFTGLYKLQNYGEEKHKKEIINKSIQDKKKREEEFNSTVANGDHYFNNKDFATALEYYEKANEFKPESDSVNTMILSCKDSLK